MEDLKLLDCTLRDGGYINDWKWGFQNAKSIITSLVNARVDIIEVGFLRNIEGYNRNITVCNTIEELNQLLPKNSAGTMFSAMAMRSNYDVDKLSPYSGSGIEMIRVTAHDYDITEGLDFARKVKEKGYKVSINPINIMGYNDEDLYRIIDEVNSIKPYQFSVVDTFGSMKRRDLDHIIGIVESKLDSSIRLGLHLHENMAISFSLAQRFVDMKLNRPVTVDASLLGMGRIPGNLPLELIADYINDYAGGGYDLDYIMDAIQDYIYPLKGKSEWGYTPVYFLSARFNLHRNYAEYYFKKGDLTHRDINHILSAFDNGKKTVFDSEYADKVYYDYKNNEIDDSADKAKLKELLKQKDVLLIAPGHSVDTHIEKINGYIKENMPVVISINFVPDNICCDFAFITNSNRYSQMGETDTKLIITSNIRTDGKYDYILNYNSLVSTAEHGNNVLILALKMLNIFNAKRITLAGADGYRGGKENYYEGVFESPVEREEKYNKEISELIYKLNPDIEFLTDSEYKRKNEE